MELQRFLQAVSSILRMANELMVLSESGQMLHFLHLKFIALLVKNQYLLRSSHSNGLKTVWYFQKMNLLDVTSLTASPKQLNTARHLSKSR